MALSPPLYWNWRELCGPEIIKAAVQGADAAQGADAVQGAESLQAVLCATVDNGRLTLSLAR